MNLSCRGSWSFCILYLRGDTMETHHCLRGDTETHVMKTSLNTGDTETHLRGNTETFVSPRSCVSVSSMETWRRPCLRGETRRLSSKILKERLVTLERDLPKLTDELQQEAQFILAVRSSRIESVELPPVCITSVGFTMLSDCTTSVGFTMAAYQSLGLGLVVEQVLGFCSDTISKDCSYIFHIFLYSDEYGYFGKPREFNFSVKGHVQLGKDLNIFDFDAAVEVMFLTVRYSAIHYLTVRILFHAILPVT
ncbi:unnamed protein product [Fraxinus pennsylvanica]|uniref:Uncharacterized protein n=1 Tax=Fraxinus pennsylvanica TaxID=56036 RepID=A0AAD1ZNY9_9LAMI|nr:unnamed protein product [Fraxinus pennsylvanica]